MGSDLSDWENASSDDEKEVLASGPPSKQVDEIERSEPVKDAPGEAGKHGGRAMTSAGTGESPTEKAEKAEKAGKGKQGKSVKGGKGKRDGDEEEGEEDVEVRSPILCIMGHVDTGKTKLLDKIRKTNVQDREAGGITQQIGATFFPRENLLGQCAKVDAKLQLKVPGLLIIDTPGHASFNNLRKRGSSLCDIAILVVDIMHGLEPQTRESLAMLRQRKCPFVVALNKMDRLYGWKVHEWEAARVSLAKQRKDTQEEFRTRAAGCMLQLTSEESLNCELYWKNNDVRRTVSVVPTSAITGEGIPDLLTLIVKMTQELMLKKIVLKPEHELKLKAPGQGGGPEGVMEQSATQVEATVLEVKAIEGLGTTIDVILVGGRLNESDTIVVCGMSGPIVTQIRALLTPHPMKELRVKGEYIHHASLGAAAGLKIAAPGLEDAVAGTSLLVVPPNASQSAVEKLKADVQEDMGAIFKSIDRTSDGVYVVASTLGSLEALLSFLSDSKIPVSGISIGTVYKLDVKKASVMRDRNKEEFSVVLAFDVKVDPEAEKEAKVLGVKIFTAEIIYHLFDNFTKHMDEFKEEQRRKNAGIAILPCVLKIIPDCIFNKKDPLVFGVKVEEGELRCGTPLCVLSNDKSTPHLKIGRVDSIEHNKKPVTVAGKNLEVCIKIGGDSNITFGRHFDASSTLVSQISRASIDIMKEHFVEDLEKHKRLVVKLKKVLDIM